MLPKLVSHLLATRLTAPGIKPRYEYAPARQRDRPIAPGRRRLCSGARMPGLLPRTAPLSPSRHRRKLTTSVTSDWVLKWRSGLGILVSPRRGDTTRVFAVRTGDLVRSSANGPGQGSSALFWGVQPDVRSWLSSWKVFVRCPTVLPCDVGVVGAVLPWGGYGEKRAYSYPSFPWESVNGPPPPPCEF